MRILVHTDEYYPTAAACAYRMKVLVDTFINKGHDVVVITSSSNKECGRVEGCREKILYSPVIRMKKKTTIMRMLNNCSFGLSSLLTALQIGKIDVVITTSPPPLVSIPGWIIAKMKKAKLIYDIRDIWPDVAIEMGNFSDSSIYCKVFRMITRFMCKHANWITTVSPGKVEKVKKYVREVSKNEEKTFENKVKLLSNGFDESILESSFDEQIVKKYKLDEKFTCVYIGNIGLAQGLDKLLDIAANTRHTEIQFLLFGTGADLENLKKRVRNENLANVHFCGVLAHEKVFTLLSKAQISFISLKSARMTDSIPTKVYEALGIGCPVFLVAEGDACAIVKETGLGKCVSPDFKGGLTEIFDNMVDNYSQYDKQKVLAKDLMYKKYSRQKIALDFEKQLHNLINEK